MYYRYPKNIERDKEKIVGRNRLPVFNHIKEYYYVRTALMMINKDYLKVK